MNELLAQIILARNDDVEGWMNILIVVILAVFWGIGGILKARAKKPEEEEEEQLADKPTGMRRQIAKSLQKRFLQQPDHTRPMSPEPIKQYRRQVEQLRRKINHPRPVVQKATIHKKPLPIPTLESLEKPELPEAHLSEPMKGLKKKYTVIPSEISSEELTVESLLDYADPDELRRAILHYEILGKPLSLRSPSEHVM